MVRDRYDGLRIIPKSSDVTAAIGAPHAFGHRLQLIGLALIQPALSGDRAKPEPNKIRFDLSQLNHEGLYGPADGLRVLHYEFCILADLSLREEVKAIDPTLNIYSGSSGRIGCQADQFLCIGHTGQPNFRDVLTQLSALPDVQQIEQTWFE
ncbi:MAG: hypothetical protein QNJ46_28495 [Leptolyngbyaceae cyanobacterium MO_188.B28]|nr:hypothetical protein [Leptolyngbyaceae cyanobacterium MO_188.B28]